MLPSLVLLGDGHGGFKALSSFPGLSISCRVTPRKDTGSGLNGDGTDDLATICNYDPDPAASFVNLFLGNGNGTFTNVASFGGFPLIDMVAADVDGDGIPELVISATTFVFAFNFNLNSAHTIYSGSSLQGVAAGDFNADGRTDFLVRGPGIALLGEGSENFEAFVTGQTGGVTGDFNGDGLTDFESNTDTADASVIE